MPTYGADSHEVAIIDRYKSDLPSCPGVTEGLGSQAPGSMEGGKKSKLAGLKVGMVTRKRRQRRASGGFLLLSGVCN